MSAFYTMHVLYWRTNVRLTQRYTLRLQQLTESYTSEREMTRRQQNCGPNFVFQCVSGLKISFRKIFHAACGFIFEYIYIKRYAETAETHAHAHQNSGETEKTLITLRSRIFPSKLACEFQQWNGSFAHQTCFGKRDEYFVRRLLASLYSTVQIFGTHSLCTRTVLQIRPYATVN